MSFSNWRSLDKFIVPGIWVFFAGFVLFCVWSLSWHYASNAYQAQDQSARYAAEAEQQIEETCFAAGTDTAKCIREVIEATHEHQRAEDGLNVQRDMANWAFGVLVLSVITLIVTAVGVWYVRNTLLVTRHLGQVQVRAYLSCSSASYSAVSDVLGITVLLANTGQSPALGGTFSARFSNPSLPSTSGTEGFEIFGATTGEIPAIASGTEEKVFFFFSEKQASMPAVNRAYESGFVYVDFEMEWRDVFDNTQSIKVRLIEKNRRQWEDSHGEQVRGGDLNVVNIS